MENTFDDIIEKIEKENKLKKLLEIESRKELYSFFKKNGYSKSEGEFNAEMEKLIEETSINLEDSDLSSVAGGALKDNLTKLTSAGMASLLVLGASPISSKAHASDAYYFFDSKTEPVQRSEKKDNSKTKKVILAALGVGGLGVAGAGGLGAYLIYKNHNKNKGNPQPDNTYKRTQMEKIDELIQSLTRMKTEAKFYESYGDAILEDITNYIQELNELKNNVSSLDQKEIQEKLKQFENNVNDIRLNRLVTASKEKEKALRDKECREMIDDHKSMIERLKNRLGGFEAKIAKANFSTKNTNDVTEYIKTSLSGLESDIRSFEEDDQKNLDEWQKIVNEYDKTAAHFECLKLIFKLESLRSISSDNETASAVSDLIEKVTMLKNDSNFIKKEFDKKSEEFSKQISEMEERHRKNERQRRNEEMQRQNEEMQRRSEYRRSVSELKADIDSLICDLEKIINGKKATSKIISDMEHCKSDLETLKSELNENNYEDLNRGDKQSRFEELKKHHNSYIELSKKEDRFIKDNFGEYANPKGTGRDFVVEITKEILRILECKNIMELLPKEYIGRNNYFHDDAEKLNPRYFEYLCFALDSFLWENESPLVSEVLKWSGSCNPSNPKCILNALTISCGFAPDNNKVNKVKECINYLQSRSKDAYNCLDTYLDNVSVFSKNQFSGSEKTVELLPTQLIDALQNMHQNTKQIEWGCIIDKLDQKYLLKFANFILSLEKEINNAHIECNSLFTIEPCLNNTEHPCSLVDAPSRKPSLEAGIVIINDSDGTCMTFEVINEIFKFSNPSTRAQREEAARDIGKYCGNLDEDQLSISELQTLNELVNVARENKLLGEVTPSKSVVCSFHHALEFLLEHILEKNINEQQTIEYINVAYSGWYIDFLMEVAIKSCLLNSEQRNGMLNFIQALKDNVVNYVYGLPEEVYNEIIDKIKEHPETIQKEWIEKQLRSSGIESFSHSTDRKGSNIRSRILLWNELEGAKISD